MQSQNCQKVTWCGSMSWPMSAIPANGKDIRERRGMRSWWSLLYLSILVLGIWYLFSEPNGTVVRMVASSVRRYRCEEGRWPQSISDILPKAHPVSRGVLEPRYRSGDLSFRVLKEEAQLLEFEITTHTLGRTASVIRSVNLSTHPCTKRELEPVRRQ